MYSIILPHANIFWYAFSVSVLKVFLHYGDHSVLTWCNLITADLGTPRQRPRRAVQNASREHPVLGDRNIRCDRWLINHEGTCAVSMGGLPLESTLWAGWLGEHQLGNMNTGHITTATGSSVSQNQGNHYVMFIFSQHTQSFKVWCVYMCKKRFIFVRYLIRVVQLWKYRVSV